MLFIFFCSGKGKGESAPGGGRGTGDGFLLKIPGGGGCLLGGWGMGGAGGCLRGILRGGGGLNFFLGGPKCPPRNYCLRKDVLHNYCCKRHDHSLKQLSPEEEGWM